MKHEIVHLTLNFGDRPLTSSTAVPPSDGLVAEPLHILPRNHVFLHFQRNPKGLQVVEEGLETFRRLSNRRELYLHWQIEF